MREAFGFLKDGFPTGWHPKNRAELGEGLAHIHEHLFFSSKNLLFLSRPKKKKVLEAEGTLIYAYLCILYIYACIYNLMINILYKL